MLRYLSILLAVASFSPSPALRAVPKPHAVPERNMDERSAERTLDNNEEFTLRKGHEHAGIRRNQWNKSD